MTPAELHRATAEAARRLGALGLTARARGGTLYSAWPGGPEVVVRNRLQPDPAFDRELLLNNLATALLSAAAGAGGQEEGARG